MNLKIDFCGYKACEYAVKNYHYSKTMPAGKLIKLGVWENEKFIGCVLFGRGANQYLPQHLGLKTTECCELVRVALTKHEAATTRIIAICLKLLKKHNPGIKEVFSYADETNQQHKGTIYKAGNWKYHGTRTSKGGHFMVDGKLVHNRSLNSKYGGKAKYPENVKKAPAQVKHFFTYSFASKV